MSNCGYPEGVEHLHVERCYEGGRQDALAEVGADPIIRYVDMGNGTEEFDEFIAENARVHFEAMGDSQFWMCITVNGRDYHINCGARNSQAKGYAICEEDAR